jgi:hypothetical protein
MARKGGKLKRIQSQIAVLELIFEEQKLRFRTAKN